MDHLPYIPPPDYTVRQPSAQAYLAQQQAQYHRSRDDHGQPHHYVPPPKPRAALFNGKSSVLEAQDDEPQADVRSEWEVKNKVLRMLSQQGVPVLPGVNLVNVSLPKADESASNIGPSKAYIKHLENHRKYDTMNSYRTVDNCQICKQMQDEMEERQRSANAGGYSPASSRSSGYKRHDSPIISGRVYQPPALTSVSESDPQEPMEDADAIAMPPPQLAPRTNGYPSPVIRRYVYVT
ncbi:Protein T04F8.7 a [Aphelenchoides avenae]|nr:Protein T04F8.7 a [Aphelenchus avenae]